MSEVTARLRVLVFGAGAIGTYVGGSLALKGHTVVFIERPEVANMLRQRGLLLQRGEKKEIVANPTIANSLPGALELGPFDAGVFALKSFDTKSVLEEMVPLRNSIPPILCLQNGVENELLIADILGEDKTIAGTVTSAIARNNPGDVRLERLRGMGIVAGHPLSTKLVAALNQAEMNARLYSYATDMKWSKMLTNLLANATSAILDMAPREIFDHPQLFRLEVSQLREALQVMAAYKFQVVDLPGTPVRALALAVRNLPLAIARTLLKNAVASGRGGKMPSFHIDLHSGRGKTEVDYLNGAVVRFGAQVKIPTPVNQVLNDTLQALTIGELNTAAFAHQPDMLFARLQ
ncbi:MAG: 2-dehydropantoate 2-reductase [Anaerolineales bacterium]|jgi:2-dehydropantoate 2-reductase